MASVLGDVTLLIKVAKAPLDKDQQRIAIFSKGIWQESTLAGSEGKEMANYIFGEIDVPNISTDSSPIPPFDLSRSMQLNRSNELVQKILAFVGYNVEAVRRRLVEDDKKRRASEEAKRLDREASEIAKIINQDFLNYKARINKAHAKAAGASDLHTSAELSAEAGNEVIFGNELPAIEVSDIGSPGRDEGIDGTGNHPPDLNPQVELTDKGEPKAKRSPQNPNRPRSHGGFRVEFSYMGEAEKRAKYDRESHTIFVNLDHSQVKAAIGAGGVDDIAFRRLAYEVAFSEYAFAVAYIMAQSNWFADIYEPINEIRETVNRITLAAAQLYAAT